MNPITPSGVDGNPLLAFESESSVHVLSDQSSFDRTEATRRDREPGLIRQLENESKLRTLFDALVGLAAAAGLALTLQATSQSFDHPMRRSTATANVMPSDVATRLESHPLAASFEPLRSGVLSEATNEGVDAIEFDQCEIDVRGARAVASCQGSARVLPGPGAANPVTGRWRFNLRKVNNAWQIQEVDSR